MSNPSTESEFDKELEAEIVDALDTLILAVGDQVTRDYEWKNGIWEGMSISNVKSRDATSQALLVLFKKKLKQSKSLYGGDKK